MKSTFSDAKVLLKLIARILGAFKLESFCRWNWGFGIRSRGSFSKILKKGGG